MAEFVVQFGRDGRPVSALGIPSNKLQTHAATTSVLAWLAAAHPARSG